MARISALLLLVGVAGCGSSYECSGPDISCDQILASHCGEVEGCVVGDACVAYSSLAPDQACSKAGAQASCDPPRCAWSGTMCEDSCDQITDSRVCYATHSTEMTSGGGFQWGCFWAHCHGAPVKTHCSDYSTAKCPTQLGCSVQPVQRT